jgi:hypothetical protein
VWLPVTGHTQSDQTHPIKELVIERHAYARGMPDLPWPFRTPGRRMGERRVDATLDQLRLASAIYLPVFPLEASQAMANPTIEVPQDCWRLAEAKVVNPPSQIC